MNGKVDPAEDAETINFELALADVSQIEKRLERLKKGRAKTKEEQAAGEVIYFAETCQKAPFTVMEIPWHCNKMTYIGPSPTSLSSKGSLLS